jgi:hypothetical protein
MDKSLDPNVFKDRGRRKLFVLVTPLKASDLYPQKENRKVYLSAGRFGKHDFLYKKIPRGPFLYR